MKTLNTGVTTTQKGKQIIVKSPYWSDPSTDLELTDKQMIKLNIGFILLLMVINLVIALILTNIN